MSSNDIVKDIREFPDKCRGGSSRGRYGGRKSVHRALVLPAGAAQRDEL